MPLGFPSLSHGTIAFGFFNIDTDLLLLEHYFFFAPEFCHRITLLASDGGVDSKKENWEVLRIARRGDIGDLMGAIHGIRFSGFIGEVYRRFPFPSRQEDFKQKPEGFQNRAVVGEILAKYAGSTTIPLEMNRVRSTVSIGEYLLPLDTFRSLVDYVWLGGYPRWRDGVRPEYVLGMKKAVSESRNWLFDGHLFP